MIFAADKAEFRRVDGEIETHLEITVSPEHRAEVRRVTLTNHDARPRELELTSYAEIVLAPHGADLAHPAFGKLFLETEWRARRRRRCSAGAGRDRPSEQPVWAVHVLAVDGAAVGDPQYETDRVRFLGRGRTPADPAALDPGAALSGTVGAGARPGFQPPPPGARRGGSVGRASRSPRRWPTRARRPWPWPTSSASPAASTRAFELAWAHSQVELRHRT